MCGICGLVTFRPETPVKEETLRRMCGAMRHRGPDDDGFYMEPGVGLGMRRLSIIDLESGHQPIHNEDQTIWIVFNGEIYNYPSLRAELSGKGHRFYTHSDTEVLVHAYEEWGEAFLERLNGMFALAIWDSRQRRVLLARDRMGIKPLYYSTEDGLLAFGSELKVLLARPEQKGEVDLVSLGQYLALEHIPPPRSIIAGISKLPAGNMLIFSESGAKVRSYWDPDLRDSELRSRTPSLAQSKAELLEHLREAVRLEMISDVPIGVFLSGGMDSSAVAAMMSQISPGNVKSFSIGFEDPSFDESRYAELVSRHLGTEHRMMRVGPSDMLDLIPSLPDILDEPMADSSIMPTYVLSKFARQYVKVALGGDGGDEIFAGYSTHQAHKLTRYYNRIPAFVRKQMIERGVNALPVSMNNLSLDFKAKRFVRDASDTTDIRHHRWLGNFRDADMAGLLTPEAQLGMFGHDPLQPVHDYSKRCKAKEPGNRVLYLDMKLYMESDILVKVDRASMANSLEVRVPLLNRELVEYVLSLPYDRKLRGFTRKYIFAEALKGKLPGEILKRGKKGFGIPISKWLRGELRPLAEEMFSEARLREGGLFNPVYVDRLWQEHLRGKLDNRKPLWSLLVFQMWHDHYIRGGAINLVSDTSDTRAAVEVA